MHRTPFLLLLLAGLFGLVLVDQQAHSDEPPLNLPKALIDGTGPGWVELTEADFTHVNDEPDTWTWKDGILRCTGLPIGVIKTTKQFKNIEYVVQWRHLKTAGNSGTFVWVAPEALVDLPKDKLPTSGIEVQMLDHGYKELYTARTGKPPTFFSTNGDVFPVGKSKMKPFPPTSPNGQRSFPRKELSKGINEWNHYYVRAINGEVRLWVNGEEVSGGTECQPAVGHLCLEAEGSPIEFKHLRIRELP